MKRKIKIWLFRIMVTGLFIAGLLLVIIINPFLTYANKTKHHNFSIYHNKSYDPKLNAILDQAEVLLKNSEIYHHNLQLDICLNEGSGYTNLIKAIRGQAFAWGFYDKVVLQGTMNCHENYLMLNDYKWNLTQLLTHEMIHCLQFDKYGIFKSKPLADIPNWKWEGYAEYIARQNVYQKDLKNNMKRLLESNQKQWDIMFEDSTISSREYYNYWILVQYCLDIKKMSYNELLIDKTNENALQTEMLNWYHRN